MTGILREFFSNLGDLERAQTLVTADARFIAVRTQPDAALPIYGAYEGRDGLARFIANLRAAFDTRLFAVDTVLEGDAQGFATGRFEHLVRATGRTFRSHWAAHCRFQDGRISYYRFFEDTAALEEAMEVRTICQEQVA